LKRERDEKDRLEDADRKRRTELYNAMGANSSPALLSAPRPKPKKSKDMRGLSLLGETEEQFRKRQNLYDTAICGVHATLCCCGVVDV
jgi:hypothetical protein